jgi:hypothetical protein
MFIKLNTHEYDFYEDSYHGWLEVRKQELIDLGIEKNITDCSYEKGEYVYLEEDIDEPLFLHALEEKEGKKFDKKTRINNHYVDGHSEIETFKRYRN